MRTILLVSAAAVLAACSDSQSTAPSSMPSRSSAAGDVAPGGTNLTQPYAKPTDQVGFTKVTQIVSGAVSVNPGEYKWAVAYCPDGSFVVGGGHAMAINGNHDAPAFVGESRPDANSWRVGVSNYATAAQTATFQAWLLCASRSTWASRTTASASHAILRRGRRIPTGARGAASASPQ